MIEVLLSLPTLVGCLVFMGLTTAAGLAVYRLTYLLHSRHQSEEAMQDLESATSNLIRVVGWLFTLLLSLTFTEVVAELALTESVIEREATAISDVYQGVRRLGLEETGDVQKRLVDYTRAVIDDDWPALAEGRLSERADTALRQFEDAVLNLQTANKTQEALLSRAIADMDLMSDYRMARLQQAREKPSVVVIVVFLGYLVTMVFLGVYRPRPVIVGMVSLYTLFVGVVIYLVLSLSDPFHGASPVGFVPFEYVLETMGHVRGG